MSDMVDAAERRTLASAPGDAEFYVVSLPVAIVLITSVSLLAAVLYQDALHWSMVPISISGALLLADLIRIVKGPHDTLGPRVVVTSFSLYFFYVAPLAHLVWDYWPRYVPEPADWRVSLGLNAWINVAGIILFLCAVSKDARVRPTRFTLSPSRFRAVALIGVLLGLVCWLIAAARFGGPVAYLEALVSETADLTGFGSILVAAEAWPSLMLALVLLVYREALGRRTWMLVGVFGAFVLLQFAVGGLRGSRALIVWPLLIGLTICHLIVRRIRVRAIICIALAVVVFAGVYGFYKSTAAGVADLFAGSVTAGALAEETGRDIKSLLTEDFGRAGVQALATHHVLNGADRSYGETYIGDIQKFLPGFVDLPPQRDKTDVITEIFYGAEERSDGTQSSRILGLGGEAMVNFGVPGVLVAFFLYGRLVAFWTMLYERSLHDEVDLRGKILVAVLPSLAIIGLISDLDNVFLFCLKYALPLILTTWLASVKLGTRQVNQKSRQALEC